MSEFVPNNLSRYQDDPALRQALDFIEGVTFGEQMDYQADNIQKSIEQAQAEREQLENVVSQKIMYKIARIISPKYYSCYFDQENMTPERWMQYRKYVTYILPNKESNDYGITIKGYKREKLRRAIPAVVLCQQPVSDNGHLTYDTFALVDSTAHVQRIGRSGVTYHKSIEQLNWQLTLRNTYISSDDNLDFNFVQFRTDSFISNEIKVPSKEEVRQAYDPEHNTFSYKVAHEQKNKNPIKIKNLKMVTGITPLFMSENPDFLSTAIGFASARLTLKNPEEHIAKSLQELEDTIKSFPE